MFIYIFIVLFLSSAILDSNGLGMAQKLEPIGGKRGNSGKQWDDGSDHENVAKVYVGIGHKGIQSIKFDYVKDGKVIDGVVHGVPATTFTKTFEIDYQNNEHIVSLDGYFDKTGVMQAVEFKTNLKSSGVIGDPNRSTKSSLGGVNGKLIVGFYGSSGKYLTSIGAYLAKCPPTKSELVGGLYGGVYWDDGPFDGVKKVSVTYTSTCIKSINVDYVKDGQVETRVHGQKNGETQEFVIDYPNEYLVSVEGTYDILPNDNYNVVRSLTFKTSKGRTSPTYGLVTGTSFKLESQGNAIVGFHGRDGEAFDAIGVYYSAI